MSFGGDIGLDTTSSSNAAGNGGNQGETIGRPATPQDATAKAVHDVTSSEVSDLSKVLPFAKGKLNVSMASDWNINLVNSTETKYCFRKGISPTLNACMDIKLTLRDRNSHFSSRKGPLWRRNIRTV